MAPTTVEQHDKTPRNDHVEFSNSPRDESGEIFLETERSLSVLANARINWRVLLISCVSFTAGMAFGFDVIVNGASISMPSFLLYFGKIGPTGPYLPSTWTSLWTAMSALTQSLSAIAIGSIIDQCGRKWPACAASALTLIGTAVQFVATGRATLMGGKMISGAGIGALMATGTVYLAEISPVKLRAPLQTGLVVFVVFVQALGLGVIRILVPDIRERAFRTAIASQWAVGGIACIAWFFAPESPLWLIRKGEIDRARRVLIKLYGAQNHIEERLQHEVQLVRTEADRPTNTSEATWLACFRGRNLKRLITVALLYSTANIGGAAFLSQNIYFLLTAGLPVVHAFDIGIGGFAFAVILILASGLYLQRTSRRNTVLAALCLNAIFMVVIGALYWVPGQGALWALAVLMNVLIAFQAALLQGAGWPIAAEVPTTSLRAKTLAVGIFSQTFSTWLFLFITPYLYNVDSGDLGARTGLVYAGFSVLLTSAAWWLIPDTTAMTPQEIDDAYSSGVHPKDFQEHARNARALNLDRSIHNVQMISSRYQ